MRTTACTAGLRWYTGPQQRVHQQPDAPFSMRGLAGDVYESPRYYLAGPIINGAGAARRYRLACTILDRTSGTNFPSAGRLLLPDKIIARRRPSGPVLTELAMAFLQLSALCPAEEMHGPPAGPIDTSPRNISGLRARNARPRESASF